MSPDAHSVDPAAHSLRLQGLTRRFGDATAVDGVSLSVRRGEFLTLLGPSGSGKTTLLLLIAGLLEPSSGRVLLDGRDITHLRPERRNFGVVFQGYALFPHMTVAENVRFPLRVRRLNRREREQRVRAALELVRLAPFAGRYPAELSGGQQQRVALARALVFDPALVLLDEPMAALDRQLRTELQAELRDLHQRLGRTFIAVTHDQDEALSLSDRVALLRDGQIVQEGPPAVLYEAPRNRFVAGFLGRANFLSGTLREVRQGGFVWACAAGRFVQASAPDAPRPTLGTPVLFSLRPERIAVLAPGEAADNAVQGRVVSAGYLGASVELVLETALGPMLVSTPAWRGLPVPAPAQELTIGWAADAAAPIAED